MKYRFEPNRILFLKNKKENIRKLMQEDTPRLRRFYLFDNDYMWKIDKVKQQIIVFHMCIEYNIEVWRTYY